MTENNQFKRKSPRLKGYDYSQDGAYFVTICTHERRNLFGNVDKDGVMKLNEWGRIAEARWQEIPKHFPHVELDQFVIMPNHMHGILFLIGQDEKINHQFDEGERHASPVQKPYRDYKVKSGSIITIIGSYKSAVTKQINSLRNKKLPPIWQRSFHDHIIRDETSLNKLREYTLYNPQLWAADKYYSDNV